MNVLYLVNAYPTAGHPQLGVFIKSQIDSLVALGVRPTVAVVRGKAAYARSLLALPRDYDLASFDLIHAHYSFAAFPAAYRRTPPLVVSFMGSDLNGDYNAACFNAYRLFLGIYGRSVARRASAVICKTEQLARQLPVKAHVIPNGVDTGLFRPLDKAACRNELGWDADTVYVCFAGDPAKKVKNHAMAAAAVAEAARLTGKRFELVVADGMPQNAYLCLLNAADLLLFTSLAEGSPNVVKEALACNKPVVSVPVGDVAEHITGIRNCRLTDGYTVEALGNALAEVAAGDMVSDGREKTVHLRLPAVAERIMGVYREVLNGK